MDDTKTDAPFLSVFDTPPEIATDTSSPSQTDTLTPFDPNALVAQFKATATAERKEQERIEQEIKAKLLELNQLRRQQQDQYDELTALALDEQRARQLPRQLELLNAHTQALRTQLPATLDQGQQLEDQRTQLTETIKQLDRFIQDTATQHEQMVAEFGGGEIGEKRYLEVEQRTKQALEMHTRTLDQVRGQYEQWQQETLASFAETTQELKITVRQEAVTVRSITTLDADIEVKHQALKTLGEQAGTIINRLDIIDQAIDQLLTDTRIAERLAAEEQTIADAYTAFIDSIVHLHKSSEREPSTVLLQKLSRAFFDIALHQQSNEEQRAQTTAATATALSKSLTTTIHKMKQQPVIDFVRLAAHLKAQVALQETKRPTLTQATKGYNDLLVFGLMTGLIGNPRQTFEPYAIEHSALGGQASQAQQYLTQRLSQFKPLLAILHAAQHAQEQTRVGQTQPTWPTWVPEASQALQQAKLDGLIDQTDQAYKTLVGEFSTLLSSHATVQKQHAEQEATRIRLRLEELDQTHQDLVGRYERSQEQLKEGLSALSLVDDALELVNELEKLVGQQQRFGLLPLARGNMNQHEEIEQRSKLLLLKLPELRRAAELVSLDLGQVDVTDPSKLKPQFVAFKARLEQTVQQARTEQTTHFDALRSLVELFDQVILGDKDFDLVIRSQWLSKELGEELFAQYRAIEQHYRQTIQTHNLRKGTNPITSAVQNTEKLN